jgi:hypothetical protein
MIVRFRESALQPMLKTDNSETKSVSLSGDHCAVVTYMGQIEPVAP